MRWLAAALAVLALIACEPEVAPDGAVVTQETLGPPHPEQWEVTDAKVITRDDLAYWIVSYDARWVGDGRAEREKCVFQTKDGQGIVIRQTGEIIEHGDDVEADRIYPDEVPGQPETVSVDCE